MNNRIKRRMRKQRISTAIFLRFSCLFVLAFLILYLFTYSFYYRKHYEDVGRSQMQNVQAIQLSMNDALDMLDYIVCNLKASLPVQRSLASFGEHMASLPVKDLSVDPSIAQLYQAIGENIIQIVGTRSALYYVNLYDLRGNVMSFCRGEGVRFGEVARIPFFMYTLQQNGERYASELHHREWLQSDPADQPFLSVCRSIQNAVTGETIGIVEVATESGRILQFLDNYPEYEEIYIYNEAQQCIYPIAPDLTAAQYYYYNLSIHKYEPGRMYETEPYTNDSKTLLMSYAVDSSLGTTAIVLQDKQIISQYLQSFLATYSFVCLIVLLFSLMVSFAVSRRMTTSLRALSREMDRMDLQRLTGTQQPAFTSVVCHYRQVQQLQDACSHMHQKLSQTVNETLALKDSQVIARLQAMQAQMNPHFLYNNISTLSAMAQEGMDEQIVTMCSQLSHMLRYIVSDTQQSVPFTLEKEFTINYWGCIQVRQGDRISLNWDTDPLMDMLMIPKLIMQPIIENSIKYSPDEEHLQLQVTGRIRGDRWQLEFEDSGPGFDPDAKALIFDSIQAFRNEYRLPEFHISGMALINIFVRLYMLYGEDAVFRIENTKPHGSIVTIGGLIYPAGALTKEGGR